MNNHKNARLTPRGREILISRLERGEHPLDVAIAMGAGASTVYKWWRRFRPGPDDRWRLDEMFATIRGRRIAVERLNRAAQAAAVTVRHAFIASPRNWRLVLSAMR